MKHITLAVTSPVIRQVNATGPNQRQIGIRDASPELLVDLRAVRANSHISMPVNGVFELSVGDTSAIWAGHQSGRRAEDFTNLHNLLAQRPDRPVKFMWEDA